jgi:arginine/ornithine N-succinyltransferase beta subunit
VNRFRAQTPEVPSHVRVMLVSLRMSLLAVNKIGELDGVFDEEDRSVISYHIVVSFFCVKFQSETSWISCNIWESFLSGNSRKS